MLKAFPTACAAVVVFLLLCSPGRAQNLPADADQPPDQKTDQPPPVVEKVRRYVEDNPIVQKLSGDGFYPRIGGLSAGSGLAGGGGYRRHLTWLYADVSAAISTKVYVGVDAKVRWLSTIGNRLEAWTEFTFRDDTKDPFYGLGLRSPPAAVVDYAIQTRDASVRAVARPLPWIHLGSAIGYFRPAIRRGRDERIRSIEQVFEDVTAPGLAEQPTFLHGSVFAEIDVRDAPGFPSRGGLYRATYALWNDRTFNQYDFRRFDIEGSQFFAVSSKDVIGMRLILSYANNAPGDRVPFYLLPSAGGGDTLRAFREYRFRDENAGVFNVELRHRVHPLVHLAAFVDAAKVAHNWQDINPLEPKMSYGLGIRAGTANRMLLRLDAAAGGDEGARVFLKFTPAF